MMRSHRSTCQGSAAIRFKLAYLSIRSDCMHRNYWTLAQYPRWICYARMFGLALVVPVFSGINAEAWQWFQGDSRANIVKAGITGTYYY